MATRPYSHPSVSYFHLLSPTEQTKVIETLQDYLQICESVYRDKKSLKDTGYMVKKGLEYFSMTCHPHLYEMLAQRPMLVEFYSARHTQFFRSLNYFEVASYTIEDLYCRPWSSLYVRDAELDSILMEYAVNTLEGRIPDEGARIPTQHIQTEKDSLERLNIKVDMMYIMPLKKDNKVQGFASIVDCHSIF